MRQDELAGNETFERLVDVGIDLGVAVPIAVGRDMAIDSCQKVKTAMGGLPMTMRDQR